MTTNDLQGRPYAKYSELKQGDLVETDADFTCRKAHDWAVVYRAGVGSDHHLYIECTMGHHRLDGQLGDDNDTLIGVYKVSADDVPKHKLTKAEAEKYGYIVDTNCYPWQAYRGPRFEPFEMRDVHTDIEAELLLALAVLGQAYMDALPCNKVTLPPMAKADEAMGKAIAGGEPRIHHR